MSEMVERVARAIAVECGLDPDARTIGGLLAWQYHEGNARAAIEAMRTPTDG